MMTFGLDDNFFQLSFFDFIFKLKIIINKMFLYTGKFEVETSLGPN